MALELDALTEVAGVLFDVLNRLGLVVGAGRSLPWRGVFVLWLLTGIAGVPLWTNYPRFFDVSPGWAVLSAGLWLLVLVVVLGVTVSRARLAVNKPPS